VRRHSACLENCSRQAGANGRLQWQSRRERRRRLQGTSLAVQATTNPDPNTFDRTLVTLRNGNDVFTFRVGRPYARTPLFASIWWSRSRPRMSGATLPKSPRHRKPKAPKTLYDRVAELPEQTWSNAWAGLPRKKSDIDIPLGMDGGRQRLDCWPMARFGSVVTMIDTCARDQDATHPGSTWNQREFGSIWHAVASRFSEPWRKRACRFATQPGRLTVFGSLKLLL